MRAALYREPELYDLLEGPSTRAESALLLRLFAAHGNGGRRALEPACGTGRLLAALAARGWRADGYDREPAMLACARRRLRGSRARVAPGELRSFRTSRRYDLAFCLQGSFRHLLSEAAAVAHLRATGSALAGGGIYLLGMDLCDYRRPEPDEETWRVETPRGEVRQVQVSLGADPARRRERILQFVQADGRLLRSEYDLRTYDHAQWRATIARSGLSLRACYDAWGRPAPLGESFRAGVFVLERCQ